MYQVYKSDHYVTSQFQKDISDVKVLVTLQGICSHVTTCVSLIASITVLRHLNKAIKLKFSTL